MIDELIVYGAKFGEPPPYAGQGSGREDVREVIRVYYENQASRVEYLRYRHDGFRLTCSLMESIVKRVIRRVNESEKYWSRVGGEGMLRF